MLDGFGTVVNALGERCKPYLKQIAGTIKWRLNNKAASVRMQAADLIGRIAGVMKAGGEEQLMGHLGVVLYYGNIVFEMLFMFGSCNRHLLK